MKTYSLAPDALSVITKMQAEYHEDLEDVTVAALFVFDLESTEPVLKHQGYPAQAVVRITPNRGASHDRTAQRTEAYKATGRWDQRATAVPQRAATTTTPAAALAEERSVQ